jgi:starch synthase (maltosyl-transferring)
LFAHFQSVAKSKSEDRSAIRPLQRNPARKEAEQQALRVSYVHPRLIGALSGWRDHFARAQRMGFSHVCTGPLFAPAPGGDIFLTDDFERPDPALESSADADAAAQELAAIGREASLSLLLDIVLDRVAAEGAMARSAPRWFYRTGSTDVVDPREVQLGLDAVPARFEDPQRARELTAWWVDRLVRLAKAGIAGFRLLGLAEVPAAFVAILVQGVKRECPSCLFLGWTPGLNWARHREFEGAGLDAVFASTPWWDARAPWFVEEHNRLRRVAASVVGVAEAPFEERLATRLARSGTTDVRASYLRALRLAAATADGLFVPMGFEFGSRRRMDAERGAPEDFASEREAAPFDISEEIAAANGLTSRVAETGCRGEMRNLTGAGDPLSILLRADAPDARDAERGVVVLINTGAAPETMPPLDPLSPAAGGAFDALKPIEDGQAEPLLAPGEVRLLEVTRTTPVADRARRNGRLLAEALKAPRIAIERITPSLDGGECPVRRVVGRHITFAADIMTDGHEVMAAELLWKAADEKDWTRVPLAPLGNDRWQATFAPKRIGRHLYTVEAWRDDYASLVHEISVKHRAGVDITLELTEALQYLESVNATAVPCNTTALGAAIQALHGNDPEASVQALTARATVKAVAASAERAFRVQHPPLPLEVERPQAEFASWYELFPRSQSGDPNRHGTFDDVIAGLPDIRDMGFDVLYFPPIHPIGEKHRKGRNNSLDPAPGDPGSPYAIGSHEGGHDAIHPQLGTFEDFRRLVAAAHENGLEIALDFAIQCSPDHPWLTEHADWFKWRPDGSIKYAENPPKKYQDIVNVDFYGGDPSGLWSALRDIVLFWIEQGVRIFRVDNPHTKPLPFWQWMIADVRARYPDAIFLAEAFTRPKMMYRLAKIGFSQSYTYFTWRNTKQEFIEYLTELTTTEVQEFFRPHFFVNTPDINPYFLQTSGRPGFLIRAALAATLSGLWGVYSGFELCEGEPLPGREEYLNSEKYEIRVRDHNAPGNIVSEITALNRIRKAHPALHSHLGVTFYNAFNDQILLYGKRVPGGTDMILVAISFDPHNVQEATFELPLWEWMLPDHGSLYVEDLMRGGGSMWSGKLQRVRLDPADLPFAIWRVAPPESLT